MSDQVILDVGNDVTFPPDPHNLPKSAESSAVPLPDTWTEEVIVGMGLESRFFHALVTSCSFQAF